MRTRKNLWILSAATLNISSRRQAKTPRSIAPRGSRLSKKPSVRVLRPRREMQPNRFPAACTRGKHFAGSGPGLVRYRRKAQAHNQGAERIETLRRKTPRSTAPGSFGYSAFSAYFSASATATATATVAPTMGLLPMPKKPIISTWAGTEELPANWASLCIRPMVSVMP